MIQRLLRLVLIAFVTTLFPLRGSADAGSDLSVVGTLYGVTRPQSGESGAVRDFTAWRNFIYVSWTDLDGDYWLDVWNVSNLEKPVAIESRYFGNVDDEPNDPLRDAHLKSPRDLRIIQGHLLLWSNRTLLTYPLKKDGRLGTEHRFNPLDSRDSGINRVNFGGSHGTTERVMLAQKEINELLAAGTPFEEVSKLITQDVIVNFQDPTNPFILRRAKPIGSSYLTFEDPPVGSFGGNIAFGAVADDKSSVRVTITTQERSSHFNSFWKPVLGSIFKAKNLSKRLDRLSGEVLTRRQLKTWQRSLVTQFGKALKANGKKSLRALVAKRYPASTRLSTLLNDFMIRESDSISLAFQKVVTAQISEARANALSRKILKQLASRWRSTLLSLDKASLEKAAGKIEAALNKKLEAEGLAAYVVRRFLAPFQDLSPELLLTLDEVLGRLSQSEAAGRIDGVLETFHTLFPAQEFLDALWFRPPSCFAIPRSTRNFLDVFLIDTGPKLKVSELAFFEFLKLFHYYLGNSDVNAFTRDLRAGLRSLHASIAADMVKSLTQSLSGGEIAIGKVADAYALFASDLDVRETLAELVVSPLLKRLSAKGIDVNMQVREFFDGPHLAQFGLNETRFHTATAADLLSILGKLRLSKVTTRSLITQASKGSIEPIRGLMSGAITEMFDGIFGVQSPNLTLEQAAQTLIQSQLSPHSVSGFFSKTLKRSLVERAEGAFFPILGGLDVIAGQGDCVSQWRVAIRISQAVASGSLVLNFLVPALEGMDVAIVEASSYALDFVLDTLISKFVSQIILALDQHVETWHTNLQLTSTDVDFASLGISPARFVTPVSARDVYGLVLRDVGASLFDPTASSAVRLVRFDPRAIAGTVQTVNLGSFGLVNSVLSSDEYLAVIGNAASGQFASSQGIIVDFTAAAPVPRRLAGDAAVAMSASSKLVKVGNGKAFGLLNGGGQIVFIR